MGWGQSHFRCLLSGSTETIQAKPETRAWHTVGTQEGSWESLQQLYVVEVAGEERCLQSRGVWGPAPRGAPATWWNLTLWGVCSLFSSQAVARPRPPLGPQGPVSSYKASALLSILSELFREAVSHMSMCCCSDEWPSLWPEGGFPGGARGEEPVYQCKRHQRRGFDPWLRKTPRGRAGLPTPGLLPGDSH